MLFIIYNHLFRTCIVFNVFRKLTWQMLDVAVEVLNQHWMNWTNWRMNSWISLWFFWLRFWLTKSLSLHRQRSLLRRNPRHRPCGLLFSFWCFFDVTLLSEYTFVFDRFVRIRMFSNVLESHDPFGSVKCSHDLLLNSIHPEGSPYHFTNHRFPY